MFTNSNRNAIAGSFGKENEILEESLCNCKLEIKMKKIFIIVFFCSKLPISFSQVNTDSISYYMFEMMNKERSELGLEKNIDWTYGEYKTVRQYDRILDFLFFTNYSRIYRY
jgi:hypothetical protein